MRIYKFKDSVDGHFAFILADTVANAGAEMFKITSLPFSLVESKDVNEIKTPLVIRNDILPF